MPTRNDRRLHGTICVRKSGTAATLQISPSLAVIHEESQKEFKPCTRYACLITIERTENATTEEHTRAKSTHPCIDLPHKTGMTA